MCSPAKRTFDDDVELHVLGCWLTYQGQIVTNATETVRLIRMEAKDGHLNFHTIPELWTFDNMQSCFAYHHMMRCQWCSVYIQTDRNSGRNLLCCCSCDHTHHSDPYTRQCLHKTHTLLSKQNASVTAHLAVIKMKSSHIFNTSCTSSPSNNSSSRNTHPKEITSIVTFSNIFISLCMYIHHSSQWLHQQLACQSSRLWLLIILNNATSCYCIKVWCSCCATDYGLGLN